MKKILTLALIAVLALSSIAFTAPVDAATNAIESPVALFETSLASKINSSATTMTLVSGTTKNGTTLASSTYAFIIDEGSASEEFVIADCTATACTNMQRGLSVITGTTTVASLQKEHRRGASVKMTDAPLLIKLARIFNGIMYLPNPIAYNNIATTTIDDSRDNLVSVGLLQDTAINAAGIISASETANGLSELATAAEQAASTATGSIGPLVLQSRYATSTYNPATAANKVVVTGGGGTIDDDFVPSTINHALTISGGTLSAATTTFSGSVSTNGIATSTFGIASTSLYAANFTYTKPTNLKQLIVEIVGAGAGGRTVTATEAGGGGGGGGYAREVFDVAELTATVVVTIGAGSAAETNGSDTTFGAYLTGTGGSTGGTDYAGGDGGCGTGGDVNLCGSDGSSTDNTAVGGGSGGASYLGGGGRGGPGNASNAGTTGNNYGGGGGGANDNSTGGGGAPGAVILTEILN